MSRLSILLSLSVLAPLGACQTSKPVSLEGRRPTAVVEEPEAWRVAASEEDAQALEALPATWTAALGNARARYGRAIANEGDLLRPDAGESRAAPPPGPYRCRAIRLGSRTPRARPWSVSRSGFCFVGVQGDQLSLTSEIVGTRLGGYLWDVKDKEELIFLGAAIPPRAKTAPAYGESRTSDRSGVVQRLGDFRYRLVIPTREGDAMLMVIEMIAAPAP